MSPSPGDPSRPSAGARVLIALVAVYQAFPRSGIPRCRFSPTCSSYARQALQRHGAVRGLWLTVRRIGRCHPFHPGGMDPVPPRGAAAPLPRQGVGS